MLCIERESSVGNRSVQHDILDDANQIDIAEDLEELERLDCQTEVGPEEKNQFDIDEDNLDLPEIVNLPSYNNYGDNFSETNISVRQNHISHSHMRMKYLQKLAKEQIWLPPIKQPKNSQNLVVLDWDDTLFPTSHLNPVDENLYDFLLEKYSKYLTEIENQAIELLENCSKHCKVVIITNAKKGWVEFSSKRFMPRLHNILMKYVKIISARVDYEDQYPLNTYKWKELAFQKLWECPDLQLEKSAMTNLITFGDSEYEMEAAKKFGAK